MLDTLGYCIDFDLLKRDALDMRSRHYHDTGEYDKAIGDLILIQKIIGYDHQVYSNMGINLIRKMEFERAIKEFDRAIDLKKDDAFSFYNRGVAYHKLANIKKQKQIWNELLNYLQRTHSINVNMQNVFFICRKSKVNLKVDIVL